jgi:putative membrane protein
MKNALIAALLGFSHLTILGQERASWHPQNVLEASAYSAAFGLLGIFLLIVGFKLFDRIITRIDFEGEIQKGNVAAGLLCAALIIGIALIVAAAIS